MHGFGGPLVSDSVHVRVEPSGKVSLVISTHSQGHGTQTTMAQVVADELGVPIADVAVLEDDSSRGGFGPGAGGSRQAVSGGGAAIRASKLLSQKIKRLAGHLLNANPQDIQRALNNLTLLTPEGEYRYTPQDHAGLGVDDVAITQVRGGQFVPTDWSQQQLANTLK